MRRGKTFVHENIDLDRRHPDALGACDSEVKDNNDLFTIMWEFSDQTMLEDNRVTAKDGGEIYAGFPFGQ